MASVNPHRVRLCTTCRTGGRTKPAGGDNCRCKVLSWRVFWRQPDGSKRSEVFTLARDANAKKAEIESSQRKGTYIDPAGGRELFEDYAEQWAATRDWKPATRQQWPTHLRRMAWALDDGARLADIDQLALLRAKQRLAGRYSQGTVAVVMHQMLAILRSAVASGRIGRDPTFNIEAAPKRRQGDTAGVSPDTVPSRAEALAILGSMPAGWRAAAALGLAGLRIGEMLGMRNDRLQLDQRKVTVDAQAVELNGQGVVLGTVKNDRPRTIVVSPLVAVELRRHLRDGHSGTWTDPKDVTHQMLFLRDDGNLWRQARFVQVALSPALEAAGLAGRFTFHGLRHFCASALLAEGCPLPAVAGYLGDHQQTIMRTYAHWLPDDADVPATILDRVLAPAGDGRDASRMPHAADGSGD
jgi:integrase